VNEFLVRHVGPGIIFQTLSKSVMASICINVAQGKNIDRVFKK
jgi:hypothetical protein